MASPYNPAQTGNYEFALKLAKYLSESEDGSDQKTNLFFSPASISLVLAMCQYGADGQTKRQMEEKIFGPDSKGEEISRWIIETIKLELESKKSQVYVLKFANRIYANANLSLKTTFVDEMVQIFKSTALNIDFGKNGDKTADEINAWVEEVTNHRIKDLVPKGLLNAETSTLLVNALYFKGIWYDEFNVEKTTKKNFYSSSDHTIEIDMMHMNENEMYYENDQVQMLSLKYGYCSAKMIIILPKEKFGLTKVMHQLNGSTLRQWISELSKKEVHMQIPKFKIEQSFNLNEPLRKLGFSLPFTDDADFSAMVAGSKIKISDVVHKAFIELHEIYRLIPNMIYSRAKNIVSAVSKLVRDFSNLIPYFSKVDEKGTEAAAASFAKMVPQCLFISNEGPKVFTADHPFLFILKAGGYEHEATILFLGEFYGRDRQS